jgi:hypothetical protein
MNNITRIYRIYNGELVSVEVEKETPKLVWVKPSKEFGYCRNYNKEYVCVTPQEAIQEELNRSLEYVGLYSERLQKAERRLMRAKSLSVEHCT